MSAWSTRSNSRCAINDIADLPNIDPEQLHLLSPDKLAAAGDTDHAPRILMLYGCLRERSFNRFYLADRHSERNEKAE